MDVVSLLLILLVIAISTILRYESYNIKKLLPKLLLMAILVNFSLQLFTNEEKYDFSLHLLFNKEKHDLNSQLLLNKEKYDFFIELLKFDFLASNNTCNLPKIIKKEIDKGFK